jgi:DNA helicase-2/ATP-dependent DNA helicase PcrA
VTAHRPLPELPALNEAQRAAVEHLDGPLLVVAGAGSGKTRVLTARIARLLERGVRPESVMAFTFTNRAAREMKERIERAVGERAARLWVGTFHATAVRILRREAAALDRPPSFAIYDREDQESILREILRRLQLPEAAYRLGTVLSRISDAKNALVTPAESANLAVSPYEKQIAECYALYSDALRAAGAFDFDDLIAETVRLLERPEIGERYARRFQHVLVDEYQDTNHAQFRLVQALSRVHRNLFVVGDDDQSIYGWRGADLANVLEFEAAFPGAEVVRLEQNYRSTGNILKAANAVIANNQARKGKNLWCDREDGALLRFVLAADEVDEAGRIRAFLEAHVRGGGRFDQAAVLYRTNAQSRALETELRQRGILYEIVGGVAFYQRREVKDVLAYLRAAINPADAVSFWRIWNTPRRGLGPGVRAQLEALLAERGGSPEDALRGLATGRALSRAALAGATDLLALLGEIRERQNGSIEALMLHVLERSQYLPHLDGEERESANDRRANVEELVAAAVQSEERERDEEGSGSSLVDFLAETALTTDADRLAEGADRVLLLTAHNAKGLEFPVVVIAGLEEGLFPHGSSLEDPDELEEERRLFYVALTRARDRVLLTAAAFRRRFDGARGGSVSRFVEEIPAELLEREEARAIRRGGLGDAGPRPWRSSWHRAKAETEEGETPVGLGVHAHRTGRSRVVGREVYHESFGRGVVVDADGEGADARYTVRFGTVIKRVIGRFLTGGSDVD